MNIWLGKKRGYLTDWITQKWVQLTGNEIDIDTEKWLSGPAGDTRKIGGDFFKSTALEEDLDIVINEPDSGLLMDLDVLRNNSETKFNPKVKDFYEHTINYGFDVWSEWKGIFKPFGRLLAVIFSKRLQQLNVPINPMDTSRGVTSDIVQLKDKKTGEAVYRIWMRSSNSGGSVIYAGIYGWCRPPLSGKNCIKVVFPLPNGNCTVIMDPVVNKDGSLLLISDGSKPGGTGFYFTLKKPDHDVVDDDHGGGRHYARIVKTMRETIHVYVDSEGILRTDHTLSIWNTAFLKLHYKIYKK